MRKAINEGTAQLAGVAGVRMFVTDDRERCLAAADARRAFLHGVQSELFDRLFLDVRGHRIKSKNGPVTVFTQDQFLGLIDRILALHASGELHPSEEPLWRRCVEIHDRLAQLGLLTVNDAVDAPKKESHT